MKVSIIGDNLGVVDEEFEFDRVEDLAALVSSESWAPGNFTDDRKRAISSLVRIDLLVLDIDDGCSLADARKHFADFKHIIATSRSHQKEKNGVVCDRFRVILFLSDAIFNDRDFKATWNNAFKRWPFIDQACKDSSRFFYASPEIISIHRTGRLFPTLVALPEPATPKPVAVPNDEVRGELWKETLKFLLEGAPQGHRHTSLIKAVGNMREQGYPQHEVIEKITEMSERLGDPAFINQSAIRTIDRMYKRELKYGYVPKPQTENGSPLIVNAADLLDEAISYLSDKDKVKGEPTGIDGLDALLGGGFRTGELTVLMAQAKTGKNTLYHHLIYKHLERGIPFGYASRELNPATEVIPNLLSIALSTNTWNATMDDAFRSRASSVLANWSLYFAPGYGHFPIEDMENWFRTLRDSGVTHFLFDHFHYALLSEDYDATASLIKKLKQLTKELDIHLSLIVQPRSLREHEQLGLATLRGGAAIGQALDNLLILERVKGEQNISKLTLEVARHKLAKLGHVFLQYNSDTTEFIEVSKETVVNETPQSIRAPQGIYPRRSMPNLFSS